MVEKFGAGFGGEVCPYACVEGRGEGVLAGEDIVIVVVDIIILVFGLLLFFNREMLLLTQWRDYLGAIDDLPARYGRSGMIVKIWRDGRRD